MKKLDKLILGSFLGPFLLTFLVVDFILLIVNMLKYFDEIFGKGLGFWIYAELIGYFVISISPMALPLAVLLSSLMTFGNLGEHFELTAIKSSGISLIRALRPIAIFTVLLVFVAFLSNNFLVPKVNLKTFGLLYDIRMKTPALDIREGVFYAGIPGYSIKVNKKYGENGLKDIIIYNHSGSLGNLEVTMADSGRMEKFFNENYMKMTLYQGKNYQESRAMRGIAESPVEFRRSTFEQSEIIFDMDEFQLSRTSEDQWSTNRAIKNIAQIKVGLDSIYTLINDQKFLTYGTTSGNFNFFTKNDPITPISKLAERRAKDDTLRAIKARERKIQEEQEMAEQTKRDSLDQVIETTESVASVQGAVSGTASIDRKRTIRGTSKIVNTDSIFSAKQKNRLNRVDSSEVSDLEELVSNPVADSLTNQPKKGGLVTLSQDEIEHIDSIVYTRGYFKNAVSMALNNARNMKNNFNVKGNQIKGHEREYRRYEIAWHQKYTQAFACFVMFLIGAPLGAIIKKGGLGVPVLASIIFFILYYMLTISGEKWAKEGVVDPLFGTWFSCLMLLPFGLIFLIQARRDARLFEFDFYQELWLRLKKQILPNSKF